VQHFDAGVPLIPEEERLHPTRNHRENGGAAMVGILKFAALLVAITFAVFLMIPMTSLFAGVLSRPSAGGMRRPRRCGTEDVAVLDPDQRGGAATGLRCGPIRQHAFLFGGET
jgi:hypothetical protein